MIASAIPGKSGCILVTLFINPITSYIPKMCEDIAGHYVLKTGIYGARDVSCVSVSDERKLNSPLNMPRLYPSWQIMPALEPPTYG